MTFCFLTNDTLNRTGSCVMSARHRDVKKVQKRFASHTQAEKKTVVRSIKDVDDVVSSLQFGYGSSRCDAGGLMGNVSDGLCLFPED